jgi:hypothetical protein
MGWLKSVILLVILTTQDLEIGKIIFGGNPRQNVHENPSQLIAGHNGSYMSSQLWQEA